MAFNMPVIGKVSWINPADLQPGDVIWKRTKTGSLIHHKGTVARVVRCSERKKAYRAFAQNRMVHRYRITCTDGYQFSMWEHGGLLIPDNS